jgi:hypothetical protein
MEHDVKLCGFAVFRENSCATVLLNGSIAKLSVDAQYINLCAFARKFFFDVGIFRDPSEIIIKFAG